MTFVTLFIWLFRDTFLCRCFLFFVSLSRLFLFVAFKKVILFLFVVFRGPTTYINILGVAKDPLWRFRGAPTLKKMLGVGPSVRFFGVGSPAQTPLRPGVK